MTLTLSVLRCPDSVPPQTKQVKGGEFSIGRGTDNNWTLPDPDRILSKRHCVVSFQSGGWQVQDTSTNGTFLNNEQQPIGNGEVRHLRDGDRLRLGGYEIELRIEEEQAWRPPSASAGRGIEDSFSTPFGPSPFGSSPSASPGSSVGFGGDVFGGEGGKLLPDDFDLGVPGGGFAGPTQPDHAPGLEQAFVPPRPAATLLPDDEDWLAPIAKPAAPPSPPPSPSPAAPPPPAASPFDEPAVVPPARSVPLPPAPKPAPVASADAAPADDLLAAFLRGAKLDDARPADPAATMERLGAAFRALVGGLRQALIARAAIKGEFRIEQTMIRARGNNPLKFSAGDDDALAALIGAGRRTDMTAEAAVTDALRDMRLHELATMAAMQTAVRALLQRFDPAPLKAEAEKGGGLLPGQRRARAFELFEALHAQVTRALADDFDSVFGKAFARAYEQALHEAADKEKGR